MRLLRECADLLIAPSHCFSFNRCIVSGVFPDDWKCSRVSPLGELDDLNNYRPISIIPVLVEVVEI